jgi:Acetyltransferase (GNAT) domain
MPKLEETAPVTGYWHPAYANSLVEFGTPRSLPGSGGWIIEREIPNAGVWDGMGCYPLFACRDWAGLRADLDDLASSLVSITVVTDPFGIEDPSRLRDCFADLCVPFKQHFTFDLTRALAAAVSPHHRYKAARALRDVTVHVCEQPRDWATIWNDLYRVLVERHGIRGVPRFSQAAFACQLEVPGLVMFRAVYHNEVVSMALWYVQGEVAYYHLGASSDLGYSLGASYGVFWRSLEFFQASGLTTIDLGAAAGRHNAADGLSQFKRGWATGQRTAYLCGRIFDHTRYEALTAATGKTGSSYFPAYRDGEFK